MEDNILMSVFLFSSDIAAFVGQNKWDIVTPFERLWKKCDKLGYKNSLLSLQSNIDKQKQEILELEQQRLYIDDELLNKKITKRQHTLAVNKLESQKQTYKDSINNSVGCIDAIHLTQKEKLEKQIGSTMIQEIESDILPTQEKRNMVFNLVSNLDISKEDKEFVSKQAESFINKSHGTLKENSAIEMFETKYNVKLDISQQFYKKQVFIPNSNYEWYVCGKMDGIYVDSYNDMNNYIVEVKNRTKSFFSTLRDYEKTQIHLYMWMTGFSKAKLVEKYNNKIRVTDIYNDNDYMNEILEYLKIFIKNFESNFLLNENKKLEYILLDNERKQIFLKKLYLNDIYKRANERLEENTSDEQSCHL
jgi:hypothetical protein